MSTTGRLASSERRAAARLSARAVIAAAGVAAGLGAHAAAPPECDRAATSAQLSRCAYEDFLAASDEQSQRFRHVRAALPGKRRLAFSQAQTAWLTFRTRACAFEAGAAEGGSLANALQWRCAARMTRERNAALEALEACAGAAEAACAKAAAEAPRR